MGEWMSRRLGLVGWRLVGWAPCGDGDGDDEGPYARDEVGRPQEAEEEEPQLLPGSRAVQGVGHANGDLAGDRGQGTGGRGQG